MKDELQLNMILAVNKNGTIGDDGGIPWHSPKDLEVFKNKTLGKTVLMGRVTYESLPKNFVAGLPGRKNIVLTRNNGWARREVIRLTDLGANEPAPSFDVFIHGSDPDLGEFEQKAEILETLVNHFKEYGGPIYIIGGAEIYNLFLSAFFKPYLKYVIISNIDDRTLGGVNVAPLVEAVESDEFNLVYNRRYGAYDKCKGDPLDSINIFENINYNPNILPLDTKLLKSLLITIANQNYDSEDDNGGGSGGADKG